MPYYVYKRCGGEIVAIDKTTLGRCDSCDTVSTLPTDADDRKINTFNRANSYRVIFDFDHAQKTYEGIINEFGDDAEAYWGIVLCRYGIDYVEDSRTEARNPTCPPST